MATHHPSPAGDGTWSTGPAAPARPARSRRPRWPRWRLFTWIIVAFNVIMLIWVISGVASTASTCSGVSGDALTNCEAANVGVGLAATLLFVLWALGDVILVVLWLVTRPRTRTCPVCGDNVKRGMTRCRQCGYDFTGQLRAQPDQSWGEPPRL